MVIELYTSPNCLIFGCPLVAVLAILYLYEHLRLHCGVVCDFARAGPIAKYFITLTFDVDHLSGLRHEEDET